MYRHQKVYSPTKYYRLSTSSLVRNSCWVIYDKGKTGTAHQCLGLAESLGLRPKVFDVCPRIPWKFLSPNMWFAPLRGVVDQSENFLKPPWPDLIIASGRSTVAPTAAIGKLTNGKTRVIQLQDPTIAPDNFDLVVAPAHDRIQGSNVFVTQGALHLVTHEKLIQAAKKFKDQVSHLKGPFLTVLLGGSSRRYRLDPEVSGKMAAQLRAVSKKYGVSLLVTPSRRTGLENIAVFREELRDYPAVVWDGNGENPYMGFLALADYIMVTSDSVSMTSEACYTGKPVYTYHLPGGAPISNRFHSLFVHKGYTRPFAGKLETWDYPPLDEFSKVTEEVKRRIVLPSRQS